VSLAPNVTDALFALGVGDRMVGVTDFCTLPKGFASMARVGGMLNPSLETIRSLRPDLLIATSSGNDPALAQQAEALGVPLYTLHIPDVLGVVHAMQSLGEALGEPARGRSLAASLQDRLDTIRERVGDRPRPRVLFIVWGDPLIVPGRQSFLTDALRWAGAHSVTEDAAGAWPSFDLESVLARRPEVILTTARNRPILDRLRRDPAWASVPAVRRHRLTVVSEAIEQPGLGVVEGVEELARLLHPDAFAVAGPPPPAAGKK
jgi:cobalamin transport system substrate-binding protein